MIKALDRKLLRDIWEMKGQTLAITMVIACGIAVFVMSLTNLHSLESTQFTYYERYRFAHIFSHVKRAPQTLIPRIRAIPGIAQVQSRIVVNVTLDVEGLKEPASGRFISVPDYGRPILNRLFLRRGRWVEPGRRGEILANEAFMLAHQLKPGARIQAVLNGSKETLTIVGVVLSPEHIFQIRPGDILPDDNRYGVFWMSRSQLEAAFDLEGAWNDVTATMLPGASEREILQRLDRITAPYGGDGAHGRHDQVSHRFLSDDIQQLRGMGIIVPAIFLGVAAFLLNVVLTRLITTQREQIAALKAFGYSHWEVGIHYFKYVLVIVIFGVGIGTGLGIWLGHGLAKMYTQFYKFPSLTYQFDGTVLLLAIGISVLASGLGTLKSVRSAVQLPPAEAMRPEPPATYRKTILERLGLQHLFSQPMRMVLRHLERKPVQALLSIFGISLAAAILVLGFFMEDSINYLIDFQFYRAQRQDMTITFIEPTKGRAISEIRHLKGVVQCEPFRSVPVRLRVGHRTRRVGILGLPAKRRLYRILDQQHREVQLPEEGLVVSEKLAELLGARPGQRITVEVLEGSRPVRKVTITALVADYTGTNAYMNLPALHRLIREGNSYSGAYVAVDSLHSQSLYQQLKETPRVASVAIQSAAVKSFNDTVAENLRRMRSVNLIFAIIIAVGVVYNTARISLAERSRELATLRVMGFTRGEISAILLGELAVLTLVAIPVGLLLGYAMAYSAVTSLATELFRIPLVIHPSTYGIATLVILVSAVASGLLVRRKLDHLDLVSVLKSRE